MSSFERLSEMAENLIGSEIIRLGGEIRALIAKGQAVHNFTIGDFDPAVFPIPRPLHREIIAAYEAEQTNYPPAEGIAELRQAVSVFLKRLAGQSYSPSEILIAGGARPLIYALYQVLLNPGDKVLFPVPSWNNNHYTHLAAGQMLMLETQPEENFMPRLADLQPHLSEARLLALCSPLNPTGTCFRPEALQEIAEAVLAENQRREALGLPALYVLYDQIYWTLTFGQTQHCDPVSLCPALRPYTIFIDGLSKSFAATGVRIGWAMGPQGIMDRMKAVLGHIGAWAPKAEQVAAARYLQQDEAVDSFLAEIREALFLRLNGFYEGIEALRQKGYPLRAIAPEGAIYLTVQFDLKGWQTAEGKVLQSTPDITAFLLHEAHIALVPFSAFGADPQSTWYRLSVGTCRAEQIPSILAELETALSKLKPA